MKSVVIDASVIVKWVFPEKSDEKHISQALQLLRAIQEDAVNVTQPPHWLAETIAVITRLQPKIAQDALVLLNAMDFPIDNSFEIYQTACNLAQKINCHLFDSLYHAIALNNGTSRFVTADEQYYKKASKFGGIILLTNFSIFDN